MKKMKQPRKGYKQTVIEQNPPFAYWSGIGGVEFHKIEHGVIDYVFCTSNAWHGKKNYHRVRINYDAKSPYVVVHGYKIPFDDVIRID